MATMTGPTPVQTPPRVRLIERFMPRADIRERHETMIRAPADLVMDLAREMDIESLPAVHAIFWLREKLMGSRPAPAHQPRGLVALTRSLGWGTLAVRPGREYVAGAVCQPWKANVVFRSVPADDFELFAEPDLVKIVWTLEADPRGPALTRFRTETRAVATDERARVKFGRYWLLARVGIVLIRRLMVPALRREAERQFGGSTV